METHRNIHRTGIGNDDICYNADDRVIRLKIEPNTLAMNKKKKLRTMEDI